ncbi:MAG TPA: CBS domain-containing protein [Actinobacteria bacterium]|nr:CBS domain-containing protein [Actinomycetota bacterium]
MEKDPRVRDLMRDDINMIRPEATLHEAVQKLSGLDARGNGGEIMETRSLVVVDEEDNLVGLIAMLDILEGMEPPFMRDTDSFAGITWDGMFAEFIHQAENNTVADAMTPVSELEIMEPDDRLMTVVEVMVSKRQRRLPVVENGKVVGVVKLYDVFHEVAREMLRLGEGRSV